jgi:hypothetical protein
MAGAQFKQSTRELVKLRCWEITESVGYSEVLYVNPDSDHDPIFAAFLPARCPAPACPVIQRSR